jgi:hypothetical protein
MPFKNRWFAAGVTVPSCFFLLLFVGATCVSIPIVGLDCAFATAKGDNLFLPAALKLNVLSMSSIDSRIMSLETFLPKASQAKCFILRPTAARNLSVGNESWLWVREKVLRILPTRLRLQGPSQWRCGHDVSNSLLRALCRLPLTRARSMTSTNSSATKKRIRTKSAVFWSFVQPVAWQDGFLSSFMHCFDIGSSGMCPGNGRMVPRLAQGCWQLGQSLLARIIFSKPIKLVLRPKNAHLSVMDSRDKVTTIVAKKAEFDGKKVIFPETLWFKDLLEEPTKKSIEVDTIVLCTGFKTDLSWLEVSSELDWNPWTWYKHCFPPKLGNKLMFFGWTRPHQGGIPACSELLARFASLLLNEERRLPANYAKLAKKEGDLETKYYHYAPGYNTLMDYPAFTESICDLIGCRPKCPSIFYFERFAQFWVYPSWPCGFRQHGPGARPAALDKCLNMLPLGKAWDADPILWQPSHCRPSLVLSRYWETGIDSQGLPLAGAGSSRDGTY